MGREIEAQLLTKDAFAPFGEVIEDKGAESFVINSGNTLRLHDLCTVSPGADGRVLISLFRALEAITLPYRVPLLECHPLGSQAFIPRETASFLIVVAPVGRKPALGRMAAFVTDGGQGVNYAPGVWHLPLCSFTKSTYVVVDRGGPGKNLREFKFESDEITVKM
jgi:ureidoglycolate lyase